MRAVPICERSPLRFVPTTQNAIHAHFGVDRRESVIARDDDRAACRCDVAREFGDRVIERDVRSAPHRLAARVQILMFRFVDDRLIREQQIEAARFDRVPRDARKSDAYVSRRRDVGSDGDRDALGLDEPAELLSFCFSLGLGVYGGSRRASPGDHERSAGGDKRGAEARTTDSIQSDRSSPSSIDIDGRSRRERGR